MLRYPFYKNVFFAGASPSGTDDAHSKLVPYNSHTYADEDSPVIDSITLPSGNVYRIADRDLRNHFEKLYYWLIDVEQTVAGGVSFNIAWDGTTAPTVASIPAGVVVQYNGTSYTGTLTAAAATAGAFYLVNSQTKTDGSPSDNYDEYVVIKPNPSDSTTWYWEKIGDTQIDLSDVVTDVTLNKQTGNVIGSNATFTVTQPKVTLAAGTTGDVTVVQSVTTKRLTASASGGAVTPTTTNIKATASGGGAAWNSKDQKTVLTGVKVTAQPTVTLAADASDGDVTVATGIGTATTRYLSASASGGAVSASGDNVTALTGLGTPATQSAVKSVSPTVKYLKTESINVVSGSTSESVVKGRTSQTTATGTGASSTTNTDWLKGISVNNNSLIIGAATLNTQTTYSANAASSINIPSSTSKTVVTGINDTGTTLPIVTNVAVGETFDAVTGYTPSTDDVLGTGSTFAVTNPTISLTANSTTATGRIQYVQAQGAATTTKLSATAAGTTVGANGTANVIGASSTFTNTQPTVALATGATAGTGVVSVATGISSVTQPTVTLSDTATSGGVQVVQSVTTKKLSATATNGNVAWNNKDQVTALTNSTSINVTKGN